MNRLIQEYKKKIGPALREEMAIDNIHAVPRLQKIVINAGIGRILQQNPKVIDKLIEVMSRIAGQRPVVTRAKKAISGFKIRQGQTVGLTVTLRSKRMYDFLDKLVNIAFPRTRDFRGLSRSGFDGRGNYNCAVREVIVFPEAGEGVEANFGLEITIVTSAPDNESAYKLLKKFNFPFKD